MYVYFILLVISESIVVRKTMLLDYLCHQQVFVYRLYIRLVIKRSNFDCNNCFVTYWTGNINIKYIEIRLKAETIGIFKYFSYMLLFLLILSIRLGCFESKLPGNLPDFI